MYSSLPSSSPTELPAVLLQTSFEEGSSTGTAAASLSNPSRTVLSPSQLPPRLVNASGSGSYPPHTSLDSPPLLPRLSAATSPGRKPLRSSPLARGPESESSSPTRGQLPLSSLADYAYHAEPPSISQPRLPPRTQSLQHLAGRASASERPYYSYQHQHQNASLSASASTSYLPSHATGEQEQSSTSSPLTWRKLLKRSSAPPKSFSSTQLNLHNNNNTNTLSLEWFRSRSSVSLHTQHSTLTTRLQAFEGADKVGGFNAPEIPRFTRMGLQGRNVVMPLSVKEYEVKKRRESSLVGVEPIRRPQPAVLRLDDSRRRGRSFTCVEQEVFARCCRGGFWRELDAAEDASLQQQQDLHQHQQYHHQYQHSPYNLPPRCVPSSTRSSSSSASESTGDTTFPFTPSILSLSSSSIPTAISEPPPPTPSPSFPAFPSPYNESIQAIGAVSLGGDNGSAPPCRRHRVYRQQQPRLRHHGSVLRRSWRSIMRAHGAHRQGSDETASTWSGEDATTCDGSEVSVSEVATRTSTVVSSVEGGSEGETTPTKVQRTKRETAFRRLLGTFSRRQLSTD